MFRRGNPFYVRGLLRRQMTPRNDGKAENSYVFCNSVKIKLICNHGDITQYGLHAAIEGGVTHWLSTLAFIQRPRNTV